MSSLQQRTLHRHLRILILLLIILISLVSPQTNPHQAAAMAQGWQQTARLVDLRPSVLNFGSSIAMSADGRTIAVGAPSDGTNQLATGAVYVYERPATGWANTTQGIRLSPSDANSVTDGTNLMTLGEHVAISADGTTIAVANPHRQSSRGAIYVFTRPAGGWVPAVETALLTASDGVDTDQLGSSVAISADGATIAAGARYHSVNGVFTGAIYVYSRTTPAWQNATETAMLHTSDGKTSDNLGSAITMSADGRIIASSVPGRSLTATPPPSIYIFRRPDTGWINGAEDTHFTLSPPVQEYQFGSSLALSADGHTLVAGHIDADNYRGAAYLFWSQDGTWRDAQQQAKLTASDGVDKTANNGDVLGMALAIAADGKRVAISARNDAGGAPYSARGAVYVYDQPAKGWNDTQETKKLIASDGMNGDLFGASVSMSTGGTALGIGATWADVNDKPQGVAYVFVGEPLPPPPEAPSFTNLLPAEARSVGETYNATIRANGTPSPTFQISSGSLPPTLMLSADTGVLSGTLTTPGTFFFTIRATNGVAPDAEQSYIMTIRTKQFLPLLYKP